MRDDKRKGKMSVEEAGRMGGEKTSETHGPEFYSEIGSKGGSRRALQNECTTAAKGKTSLEAASHKGGQRVRKLLKLEKNMKRNSQKQFHAWTFPSQGHT